MDVTDRSAADLAAECVARIDAGRLVATVSALIARPSVNPFEDAPHGDTGEGRVADYLGSRLRRLGWACEVVAFAPGRHNVIARLPGHAGHGGSLMLAGHTGWRPPGTSHRSPPSCATGGSTDAAPAT